MAQTQRPNILWYCTDQQRYDTIHALGNQHIHTPHLDEQVEAGVAFTNAYTQCPICTPSRATFLTGRYPATHHVHRNGVEYFPDHEVLVTRLLAEAGYDCGLIGKLHLSRAEHFLEKRPANDGYRFYKWSHHPNPDYPEGHDYADWLEQEKGVNAVELYSKLSGSVGAGVPTELHQTTWCSEMAIQFIQEEREGPWMLSINPFDPHPPFDPPQEYLDRYNAEEMPYPLFEESDMERQKAFREIDQQTKDAVNPYTTTGGRDTTREVPRGDMGSVPPDDYDARLVKACYYAMVELIDDQFGRIIDALRATNQLENTIIIFTSDHGELLGDHGLIYKGCRFFESLVHVPLIMSWQAKGLKGVRSDALVELVDLAPTLLEAAGLEIPYYMQGKSLLPLLTGEQDLSYHKPHVISEYHGAIGGAQMPDQTHGIMYFDGRYKIVIYQGHSVGELYDLQEDPGEFQNLWDRPEFLGLKTDLLHKAFDAYLKTSSAGIRRTAAY
ncbi:sulfatase-like hydrolase/transferase [candidate division KSB3 bacterium]|uniref:Sulfatase-like hydrolase/transferase n=1 Tax=candidate division KSB3 bacterium TaxID=2044937 RepID=A0A9D5JVP5_9BACT|nr:sulfatase-like hydrolase/transferase [candidate division KSB3 bacterium]MBD3325008.1 sulfatase-like hydrolase/transferase [candidate division KSB3 bacterium]